MLGEIVEVPLAGGALDIIMHAADEMTCDCLIESSSDVARALDHSHSCSCIMAHV